LPRRVETEEEILDFSDVRPFEPLDDRVLYKVRVDTMEKGLSQRSAQKKIRCEFSILEPDEVAVEEWEPDESAPGGAKKVGYSDRTTRAAGRKLFREYSLQSQALPFLYQLLKALDPNVELNEAFRFNPADWIGMEAAVRIHNEAFEEQIRPRIDRVYPVSRFERQAQSPSAEEGK